MKQGWLDQHPITYMGIRGLTYGAVFGALYGTILAPVFGSIIGGFLGGFGGFAIGNVAGILIYIVTAKSLYTRFGYRETLWLISGLVGFIIAFASLMSIFSFWESLDRLFSGYEGDEIFVELFAQLALIPALIAAFCSAYVSNKYANLHLEQHDESDQSE
jgi:hypothetical protein